MKKLYIYGLMVMGFAACKPDLEPIAPVKGDADFTSYLAVGNSTSAGIMDGALYREGQMNSFPNILATQFEYVGGGDFLQPLVPGEYGWPRAKKELGYVLGPCDTIATVKTKDFEGALDTVGTHQNISAQGPFNNQGIPLIKAIHYGIKGYAAFNPFAARLFKSPATTSALDQIDLVNHTFFTLWVGNNDVLSYASNGGDHLFGDSISKPNEFAVAYDSIMSTITRNGAKGVVITIPNILQLPYFNTIPPKGITKLKAETANSLNLLYNGTQVSFAEGANYFVIEDQSNTNGFRQIRDNEYVLLSLPMDSVKCRGWGTLKPIPSQYVLTADEVAKITAAISNFNSTITSTSVRYQIPVLDIQEYFGSVVEFGVAYNGVDYTMDYGSGGIISLDGIHLTGKGNALLANRIIERINTHYGSTIPYADVNKYSGITYP